MVLVLYIEVASFAKPAVGAKPSMLSSLNYEVRVMSNAP